ncbi:MAG: hypothetical protein ACM30E_04140 [Nitrososphaerales archaeon]
MQKLLGVLVLMAGVIFPMAMVAWLALRINRKPALPPDRMGLILAFNGILPVGLVLLGFSLLSPTFGAQTWVRLGSTIALAAAAVVVILGVSRGRRTG